MGNSPEKDDFLIQIRDKLRKDGVKLWLKPYYNEENGSSEEHIKALSRTISESLSLPNDMCFEVVKELQVNSLENLMQRSRFQNSGLATLKIKVVDQGKAPKLLTKEVMLSCRGNDLKQFICQDILVDLDKLKLISAGKIISANDSLFNQGIKNGQQILAIVLAETPIEVEKNENKIKELESVKTDSQLLALDDHYLRLEDQFGNPIKIPNNEKKALIVAMTLHEKGRSALKKEDYSTGLVFFLEADQEFRNCSSALLKSVDNYALLDLDIAWCFLCLQSFTHLPEAEERLHRCEKKFQETYGTNMERLIAVKGSSGNEDCLLARLHLLQAVLLYHQNKRSESLSLLKTVQTELLKLKVNENSILALVELGYSETEAKIGLRAVGGDVNLAANYINENRQKRYESRKKAIAEEILNKERKKLGKCADGKQYVDPNFLNILVNMGYNKEVARIALRNCNNIISDSIQYIQENPLPGPSESRSMEFMSLIEDLVPQLVDAGFDARMAKIALQKHGGDIMKSAEELLLNGGIVSGDLSQFNIRSESIEEIKRRKKEEEMKEKAFERLKEDISIVDDDYLDINLEQEEVFLNHYLSLLEKK
ncbi:NEDD8 ultimate buster 1-like [Rhynchophorus ferrugineus]|uniref:NEDD8 ultimate buster 1-like n=1 Tax=Rhynchophorus ferrugineus TaxID=354439 RepID=UPI003FCE5691